MDQNFEENLNTLTQLGAFSVMSNGIHGSVNFHTLPLSLDIGMLRRSPSEFVEDINALLLSVASHREEQETVPAPVKSVPTTFGRVYNLTRAKHSTIYQESRPLCTICMEPLLSPEKKWSKVWQLHGPQCTFHMKCIRKWHTYNNTCPNCGQECCDE